MDNSKQILETGMQNLTNTAITGITHMGVALIAGALAWVGIFLVLRKMGSSKQVADLTGRAGFGLVALLLIWHYFG